MNAVATLEKMDINVGGSISRALTQFNMLAEQSGNRHSFCNRLIVELGGKTSDKPSVANVIALTFIEQVMKQDGEFDVDAANEAAADKVAQLAAKHPSIFVEGGEIVVQQPVVKKKVARTGNPKKEQARLIFEREAGQQQCEIAKIMAKEMKITFANAYYYVTRVFQQ